MPQCYIPANFVPIHPLVHEMSCTQESITPMPMPIGFAPKPICPSPIQWRDIKIIGIAPITQVTHVRNNNSNIQGRSLNVIYVIFHTLRYFSLTKKLAPSGSKFLPLREVPILKRDTIDENHCLMCVTFSVFWLRHCKNDEMFSGKNHDTSLFTYCI